MASLSVRAMNGARSVDRKHAVLRDAGEAPVDTPLVLTLSTGALGAVSSGPLTISSEAPAAPETTDASR